MFEAFNISGSGMTANRLWLDTISNNIANINSTGRPGDPEMQPYKRKVPVFSQLLHEKLNNTSSNRLAGVEVTKIVQDHTEPHLVYSPAHPHADENGYIASPGINITNEMANMMAASRAYEANVTAFQATKEITQSALQILR